MEFRSSHLSAVAILAASVFVSSSSAGAPGADTPESHAAAAVALAGDSYKGILRICGLLPFVGSVGAPGFADPVKIFDNLYFVGFPDVTAWAIATSEGIIVVDSLNNANEAQTFIEGGLRKLGLDPARIRYVIITHAHDDHYGGAQYLADKFHAVLIMSALDWNVLATRQPSTDPNSGPIPKRGMSVGDGDKLTLGDTTVEFVVTPPHTPGTLSLIIPLKDVNAHHVAGLWGGTALFALPQREESFTAYIASTEKFSKIAHDRGVDVPISNHSLYDDSMTKIAALRAHRSGEPNPFVMGPGSGERFLSIAAECAMAARARVRSASGGGR